MNNRTVLQYDLSGVLIAKWNRVIDAAKSAGVSPNTIIHCCKNRPKYQQAAGYIWVYQDDSDKINDRVKSLPIFSVDNLPNEEWRNIVGYEGLYQVSNFGRIKSLRAHNKWGIERESILVPAVEKKGYKRFCLNKNGKSKTVKLHRVVALAFIPNPYNKPCVDHIDGNPSNNNVSNLRWVTYWENKHNPATRHRVVRAVAQYTRDGKHLRDWFSAYDAAISIGANMGSIRACCRGETHTAAGYIWKYINHKQYANIYISIPISHLDAKVQRAKAAHIAERIKTLGHEPVNPFDTPLAPPEWSEQQKYAYYMGEDIKRLLMCDAAYFSEGWKLSKGCLLEFRAARIYNIGCYENISDIPAAK